MKKFCLQIIKLFLLLISAGSVQYSVAQYPVSNLTFDLISTKQGLAGNTVNDVLLDTRGFLWVGTTRGISRYDGFSFKNYSTTGAGGITDKVVHCLAEDKAGNIWIGTENGLNKLDPHTNTIKQYFQGNGPGTIPYKWCNSLCVDKNKDLWLATEKGLALYNDKTDSFQNFPIILNGKDARINKFISDIFEDSKGRFWLATSYGIKLFDRRTKTYRSYHKEEPAGVPLSDNIFSSIIELPGDNIVALSYYNGLFSYNPAKDAFEKSSLSGSQFGYLSMADISNITIQGKYYLLMAGTGGLFFSSPDAPNQYSKLNKIGNNLEDHDLQKIYHDRQGNIWVGGTKGLYKVNLNSLAMQWVPVNDKHHKIFFIIPDIDRPAEIFYLNSPDAWYSYDNTTGKISPFSLPADKKFLFGSINAWIADKNGYWFTAVNGFGYLNIHENKLTDLTPLIVKLSGQGGTSSIAKDRLGRFWLTIRRTGILVYDPATNQSTLLFSHKDEPDNVFGTAIQHLVAGPDGNIYFTAANKLYIVDPADLSYKTHAVPAQGPEMNTGWVRPSRIFFLKNGRTLITSNLFIYELKDDRLNILYPEKGLSPYAIEKIFPAPGDIFWVKTDAGYFKTDTAFSKWIFMNPVLNIPEEEVPAETYTGVPGEVLFTWSGNLGILKESMLQKTLPAKPVIVSKIRAGNNEQYLVSSSSPAMKCSYKDAVEIELAPVNYLHDKETRVLYKLDGWDDKWKELGSSPVVRYEQLPPGNYTFETKAINGEGVESENTKISFRIIPPFYRTWWFISALFILFGLTIWVIYRYRLQKALQMERMRTRIATDLHDDIGATLSSISMYSEAVKNQVKEKMPQLEAVLNKMGENSRDMVNSMSDIVWAINPNNDDGEKLVQRMEGYARDICAVKNVQLDFNSSEKVNDIKFSLEQRKNIYLVFKEALNNALKYSQATQIGISIDKNGNQLSLHIKDNGKGFDMAVLKTGNGLKNMKLRAGEINAIFTISSSSQDGTTVELVCDL